MIRNTGFIFSFVSQDNETDTDNEEIKQRDVAIAEAELAAAHLQREIRETEQAELTDTGTDTEDHSKYRNFCCFHQNLPTFLILHTF